MLDPRELKSSGGQQLASLDVQRVSGGCPQPNNRRKTIVMEFRAINGTAEGGKKRN